jgi:hypothetical protein
MHVRVAVALVAALGIAGAAAGPAAAEDGLRLRPTEGGEYVYGSPESVFAGDRVVVHWVDRGPAAPPLNDDDLDAIPDYVEQVAAAGDGALAFYERRGFRSVAADTGGPDARPDLYVADLPFGVFGYMAPPSISWDGAFVVLSAQLDRREPVALGSLRATVGHELFHVVQQSYVPELPPWVAEGTADALASLAAPGARDFAEQIRQGRWADHASDAIADNDPYAASAVWRYLEVRNAGLVAALLERRARMSRAARAGDPSWYRTLDAVYRARSRGSFDAAFGGFARQLVVERVLAPRATIRPGKVEFAVCSPLSIRVLRLALPGTARRIDLRVAGSGRPHVQLVLADGRTVVAGPTGRLRARLRGGEQLDARLVVTGRALTTWGRGATVSLAAR